MPIPLCQMIPMLVVKHALNIDILKMKHAFHSGYKEGDKVFYVSPTNQQGGLESIVGFEIKWNNQWKSKNDRFKEILHSNPNLKNFPIKYFFVWDGNHSLWAWLPYIDWVDLDDSTWHITVDAIVLDIVDRLVELLTTMINLNK